MQFISARATLALSIALVSGAVFAGPEPGRTDQLVVKFDSGLTNGAGETRRLSESLGQELRFIRPTSTGRQIFALSKKVSNQAMEKITTALRKQPGVSFAEPDIHMAAHSTNDPHREQYQWHYKGPAEGQPGGLNVEMLWGSLDTTYTEIVVAVLDTGITPHPDLDANLVQGYDMISDPVRAKDGNGRDTDPRDEGDSTHPDVRSSWHGTHVSGTVSLINDNGLGMAGVGANRVKVMPVRVLGVGGGSYADIGDAIIWSAQQGARVINMSLGGQSSCAPSSYMQEAINSVVAMGVTVVVSAGNSNTDTALFTPASCQNVINVAAGDPAGNRSSYSNFGDKVDVMAPGGGNGGYVWSAYNTGMNSVGSPSYAGMMGTSMAAPHVSGLAALALTEEPSLSPFEVEALIKSEIRPFTSACSGCGTGLADAQRVMATLNSGSTPTLPVEETPLVPPATPSFLNFNEETGGGLTLSWGSSSDADFYELEVAAKEKGRQWGAYGSAGEPTNLTYLFHDPGAGTFRYRVRASNSAGASDWFESAYISLSSTDSGSTSGNTKCNPKRGCK